MSSEVENMRNIAIVAHVDHGKTTMVDCMLRQSGVFRDNQQIQEQALDTGDLERERGITILAKCTSVEWQQQRINIVDTPGHADFGGEVERVLSMVDGCLLLVDAAEGPMPQTKFVLSKVLAQGLRPIVIINKVDRSDARANEVLDEIFDLFAALDANEDQLDFPVLYGSSKEGWLAKDPDGPKESLEPLFNLILSHVAPPSVDPDGPFRMLVTTLEANPYLGPILSGRILSGSITANGNAKAISQTGELIEQTRVTKILAYRGLERVPLERADAGDIVALAGFQKATVADTICDAVVTEGLEAKPIDPPTLAVTFSVNDSPYAGQEGDKVTSRMIRDRLMREAEGNVAIQVSDAGDGNGYEVAGRGELQLGVLIETMRREGYEMSISRPRVVYRTDPDTGGRVEPIEEVVIDVDEAYSGVVVEKLSARRSELIEMRPSGGGKQRLMFHAPSRALIGYHGEFLTDTRGTGVMHRVFHSYEADRGSIEGRHQGVIISTSQGNAVAYALWNLEERGPLFVEPGEKVYCGMLIGEHNKGQDIDANPLKTKQLTNVRASGSDDAILLTPPIKLTLERAIAYIADDELVEVTPQSIRLRKRYLDPNDRKREARKAAALA
ncbi:MAG: translational GTPase TypA [Rhodospirillaceae bacterium]|nr:translational GTPase TypA [Rhodospirillaceae bacterium]|tara:strand:+ start:4814 stop:6655 length:1842 start_codon:yes stop_codon:yes gene_type:complete